MRTPRRERRRAPRSHMNAAMREPRALRFLEATIELIGRGIAWLVFGMAAATGIVVGLRYGLEVSAIPLQEAIGYMQALVILPGLAYALRHDAHVRVDVAYSRMTLRGRRRVDLVGHVALLAPTCLTVFFSSLGYVGTSWRVLEGSPEVGGIPAVFALKTLIPVAAALLFAQGVVLWFRAWRTAPAELDGG